MTEGLDRRSAVKAVAATGGLLLLSGLASADESERRNTLTGEWLNGGNADQPCAIIQHGRVLLLINENGDIATGQLTKDNQFSILKGWEGEVVGRVLGRGKAIAWKGGGSWKRR
jgi:hypothetical protein